jgi:iron complex transport system substrate-binding protein
MLGKVTGHAEKAATLVSQMKEQVDRLATIIKRIPDGKRRKVFYQVWDDPLMTAGPNSFIGEALRLAGLDNIFLDSTTSYPRVSDEVLVSRNPDVIIAPSTHASKVSVDTILNRQGWSEIKAIQEKQVFIIDGDQISRCGPRLLDAIEEIIRVTYPDLVPAEHKEETP